MNSHRLKSESETVKQTEYTKKQQQLRAMNKPFVPNKTINADAMIENLLSNKETFQKKKDSPMKALQPPSWLVPDNSGVSPFYSQVWHLVRMSRGQLADTAAVSSLLMTSGLSTDTLGFIWSLANKTVPGSLTHSELYVVLALVALAQGGYIFNDTGILNQIQQPPIPKLDLTILPQYNMNFTAHSTGVSAHYLQPSICPANPVGIDSSLPVDRLDNSSTVKDQSPVSIVSLDVNKLQGSPILTLPNYNFGPYQVFEAMGAGAVITNQNTNTTSIQTYQEPSSAIPSISLGLSTPTKVNSSYQPSATSELSVLDRDITSDINSDVASFNNINKFKLDSPTKLPSLSQNVGDVSTNFSKLSLTPGESKTHKVVENETGQTSSVDDSFDCLSTERATVNQPKLSAPNYNLDLFDLSGDVQHVFPDSGGASLKDAVLDRGEKAMTTGKQNETLIDGDFDDEFTDFQSADFTSFNASVTGKSMDVTKSIDVSKAIDVSKSMPVVELTSKFEPEVSKVLLSEEDDFNSFQEAPVPANDDDLFPKIIIINAPNEIGVKSGDNSSFYEKSEPNYSEWSDNTSNDWTVGSGGNKSDERDTDSLNYVDLSDIKLEIPTSDTEDAIKPDVAQLDVKGNDKEDRYSALRGLQPNEDVVTNDEFGDFLAAEPGEYQMSADLDVNDSPVQIRCLEVCLQILQESYSILSSASTPKVLSEVMSDPRTTNHLTCLLEVFRVSERLIKHIENNDNIVTQIQSTWNDILPLLEGSKCYQLEDTTGPVCELCRCDYGPFPMKYGRSTYHAPCANLYLHYVDSTLPNSEAY